MKNVVLLLSTVLVSTVVLAGGGLFGGKTKATNPNGVKSIAVELCGVGNCPKLRLKEGACVGDNVYKKFGVCLCDLGYVAKDGNCEPCPTGYYSDGQNECTLCGPGTHSVAGKAECVACDAGTFAPGGTDKCYACPNHADCSNESFACQEGFKNIGSTWENLSCVCNDGTTLNDTQTGCVSCASLNRQDGTNGNCGMCLNGQAKCGYGDNAVCCAKGYMCTADNSKKGQCYQPSGSCATNADCSEPGTFCYFEKSTSQYNVHPNMKCDVPVNGQCLSVSDFTGGVVPIDIEHAYAGLTYSNAPMNWWSANNFCMAQSGLHLITKDELYICTGTSANPVNKDADKIKRQKDSVILNNGTAIGVWTSTVEDDSCFVYVVASSGTLSANYTHTSATNFLALCNGISFIFDPEDNTGVCENGTTLNEEKNGCVRCSSLHRFAGTNGQCGDCMDNYEEVDGVCEKQVQKCSFSDTNSDCGGKGSGYFCDLRNKVNRTGGLLSEDDKGICTPVDDIKSISGNKTSETVDWFTAYSFCQALGDQGTGLKMVTGRSGSSVVCYSENGALVYGGGCREPSSAPSGYWLDTCMDDLSKNCSASSGDALRVNYDYTYANARSYKTYGFCE